MMCSNERAAHETTALHDTLGEKPRTVGYQRSVIDGTTCVWMLREERVSDAIECEHTGSAIRVRTRAESNARHCAGRVVEKKR